MTDGVYDHERQRLYALVDAWVDQLNEAAIHMSDQRIQVAVIGGILNGSDSDGDDAEAVAFNAEPRGVWQQVGLFTQLLEAAATGHEASE